jgi:hypothetical protein
MTAALHKQCSRSFSLAGGSALIGACLLICWGATAGCKLRCTTPPHLSAGLQSARSTAAHQHASAIATPSFVPDGYRQVVPAGGGAPVMLPVAGESILCASQRACMPQARYGVVCRDTCDLLVIDRMCTWLGVCA